MVFSPQIRKQSWKKTKAQHPLSLELPQPVVKSFRSGQAHSSSFHTAPICPEHINTSEIHWETIPELVAAQQIPELFLACENEGPVRTPQQLVEIWVMRSNRAINAQYSHIFCYNLYLREKHVNSSSKNKCKWPPSWLMIKTKWKKIFLCVWHHIKPHEQNEHLSW